MATTPNLGLRYPAAGDAPDGPGAIYNLATDVDNALASVDGTSGISYNDTHVSFGSGRATTLNKLGHLAVMSLMVNVGSHGIAGDGLILTIPSAFFPGQEKHGTVAVFNGDGSNTWTGFADIQIATNGQVTFKYASGGNGLNCQFLGELTWWTAN